MELTTLVSYGTEACDPASSEPPVVHARAALFVRLPIVPIGVMIRVGGIVQKGDTEMSTSVLNELMQKIDLLTPEEQLWLITHLAERVRTAQPMAKPRRKWREIRGITPYPLVGEDAQVWVTRSRLEGTERREKQWRPEA